MFHKIWIKINDKLVKTQNILLKTLFWGPRRFQIHNFGNNWTSVSEGGGGKIAFASAHGTTHCTLHLIIWIVQHQRSGISEQKRNLEKLMNELRLSERRLASAAARKLPAELLFFQLFANIRFPCLVSLDDERRCKVTTSFPFRRGTRQSLRITRT